MGSVDIGVVVAEYRRNKTLQTSEYREACAVSAEATARGRQTGTHGFGASDRQQRTASATLHKWGLALQLANSQGDNASIALHLAHLCAASDTRIDDMLSVVRRRQRAVAARHRAELAEQQKQLDKYQSEIGDGAVKALQTAVPALRNLPMSATPGNSGVHIRVAMPSGVEAGRVAAWVTEHSHSSGLATNLDQLWAAAHVPVAPIDDNPCDKAPLASDCWRIGMCVCSDPLGMAVARRVKRFTNHMKEVCAMHSQERQDLKDGKLAVRLTGLAGEGEGCDDVAGDGQAHIDVWLHIGLQYFSPYEPTFWRVQPVANPGETLDDPRRVYVSGTAEWLDLHRALWHFRESPTIASQWFHLEESSRPIPAFTPDPVPLIKFARYNEPVRFWPRKVAAKSGARGRGVGRGKGGGGRGAAGKPEGANAESSEEEVHEALMDVAPEAPLEFDGLLDPLLAAYDAGVGTDGSASGGVAVGTEAPTAGAPPPEVVADMAGAMMGSDEPPLPPPPVGPRRRRVEGGEVKVPFCNGFLVFFHSNNNFEAQCMDHPHERCTFTKKSGAAAAGSDAAPRRPLGLLAAWLALGCHFPSKGDHRQRELLLRLAGPEEREYRYRAGRLALMAVPGADELFEKESPSTETGLESEPLRVG